MALRAQINPHFLFNALTTIGYLVTEAPERAVDPPLVENAVKHGIAASRGGGTISIAARRLGDRELHIEVRNTAAPLRGRLPGPLGGVGLRNVERRLATYYGDAAILSLTSSETGETIAEIRIPIKEDADGGTGVTARRARA